MQSEDKKNRKRGTKKGTKEKRNKSRNRDYFNESRRIRTIERKSIFPEQIYYQNN